MAKPNLTAILQDAQPPAAAEALPIASKVKSVGAKKWGILTVRFPAAGYKRLKRISLDLDEPVQLMIEKALNLYLEQRGVAPIKDFRS